MGYHQQGEPVSDCHLAPIEEDHSGRRILYLCTRCGCECEPLGQDALGEMIAEARWDASQDR